MKCTKCGYTSFDHNQNCPKCNYDLVAEATKMNLPSYFPSPPYLLASLLGGKDEYISIAPSQDDADSQSKENSVISIMDDIKLPQRTILPGLAEAVAELTKEEEEPNVTEAKDINAGASQEQQEHKIPNDLKTVNLTFNSLNQPVSPDASGEHDEDDVFEFVLDDESPGEPEPASDPQGIELTMLSEEDEDQQTQPEVKIIQEEKPAQSSPSDDLVEPTMEDKL